MNLDLFPADRRSLEKLADESALRASKNLAVYRENIRPIDPESMETNRAALGELRRIKASVASQSPSGNNGSDASGTGNGWDGGGSDGTTDPGDVTNYDDLLAPFSPGDATTPGATVTYEARTKSGSATLCGLDEYIISSPPRKYRLETWTGTLVANCSNGFSLNQNNTQTITINATTCGSVSAGTSPSFCTPPTSSSTTATQIVDDAVNVTVGIGICGCAAPYTLTQNGHRVKTLSDEDTEEDAIARAPDTWSAFGPCTLPCCGASRAVRTGLSFGYSACEMRISLAGMPAGEFTVSVPIIFTDAVTGESTIVETRQYSATPAGGAATVTVAINPADSGGTYSAGQPTYAK